MINSGLTETEHQHAHGRKDYPSKSPQSMDGVNKPNYIPCLNGSEHLSEEFFHQNATQIHQNKEHTLEIDTQDSEQAGKQYKNHHNVNLQAFIPALDSKYFLDPDLTDIVTKGIENNLRVIIYGPHGSGKSSHIEQICARMHRPCIRVNFDNNILRSDLIGKDIVIIKDGMQVISFKEGVIPFAMQAGLVLILDEYDSARSETLFVLQKILEEGGKLFLFEENKEIIPHPNFRIFATANTIGGGDDSGYYSGTQIINQSNLDRWDIIAKAKYLLPEQEIELIKRYFSALQDKHENIAEKIIALANLIRSAVNNDDLSVTFSTRTTIAFCKNLTIFDSIDKAWRLSYLNRLTDNVEISCAGELFDRCFG